MQVAMGMAMLTIVGGVASFPVIAKGAPQIAAMGAATGTAAKLAGDQTTGLKRATEGAKSVKSQADKRAKEADEVMADAPKPAGGSQALHGKVFQPGEIIAAFGANPTKAAKDLVGVPVQVNGVVLEQKDRGDHVMVMLGPEGGDSSAPLFAFRMPKGTAPFEPGKLVTLEGTFVFRTKVDGMANEIYLVESTGAQGPAAAAAAPEEPKVPFDGWRYVGSVQTKEGATGVFTREGETIYAQNGDILSDGVKVFGIKAGEATFVIDGEKSVVTPW